MLQLIFTITFLTTLALPALAGRNKFIIGSGININKTKTDEELNSSIKEKGSATYAVMIMNQYRFAEAWYLRASFGYDKKTARFQKKEEASEQEGEQKIRMHYWTAGLGTLFKFTEDLGVTLTAQPHFRIHENCKATGIYKSCDLNRINTPVFYLSGGLVFQLHTKWALDLNYQYPIDYAFDRVKVSTLQALLLYSL
jgi:lipopolysaccharide assembly outer membrane protein LptD (OstA)